MYLCWFEIHVGRGPGVLAVGEQGDGLEGFNLSILSVLSHCLWERDLGSTETKNCQKGSLNLQPTNSPTGSREYFMLWKSTVQFELKI